MRRLLIVHHTVSPALQACLEAVRAGATDDAIEDVEVVTRAALAATAADALAADGFVLGTPANIGYMSGALRTRSRRSQAGDALVASRHAPAARHSSFPQPLDAGPR